MIDKFENSYFFLSNFYPSPVEFERREYPTIEHAFQAAKTLDENERINVCNASAPGKAKRLGRKVCLRNDWEKIKIEIMFSLLLQKFSNNDLKQKLIETENHELIEGNNWGDTFWGKILEANTWKGQNQLGKLLMKVREIKKNDK